MLLTDTSILIDYLRKRPDAVAFVNTIGKANLAINTIIAMELYQGALNKPEFTTIQKELQGFFMLPVNEPIAQLALQLSQLYALSHHIGLPDTFIAATALIYNIELRTYNIKDFRFIPRLRVSNSLIY
ncbi:type II toxin-antitoxin system VapC family toxin [Spirosoma rhododendri]|uniref:Type II toxin-antitoxin system VapC family toxin n=1 Tax=Spirosoma rhododendri TaxID=2728024 RepID=A0A7L5DVS7_9BACT|nr:type II toxin-antitoxin system VapC family toxin [Spirosoma rhododendri]QJD79650.1 type II toxin-antitoxin system VapC family toxin [Spirosoma rhododendri]